MATWFPYGYLVAEGDPTPTKLLFTQEPGPEGAEAIGLIEEDLRLLEDTPKIEHLPAALIVFAKSEFIRGFRQGSGRSGVSPEPRLTGDQIALIRSVPEEALRRILQRIMDAAHRLGLRLGKKARASPPQAPAPTQ